MIVKMNYIHGVQTAVNGYYKSACGSTVRVRASLLSIQKLKWCNISRSMSTLRSDAETMTLNHR